MKKNNKIAIVGTVGLPAKYGGWETLTNYICLELNDKYDITVFCTSKKYDEQLKEYNGVKLQYIDLDANGIQSIPYDIISMYKSLKFADTILILGVSGCIALPIFKLFSKKKFIVNIDGLEWKRDKWGKFAKWFLKISESMAVKFADIVIADNKAIQSYVFNNYGKESKLIAYGADHSKKIDISTEISEKYKFLNNKFAFKVCRIEPENNLDMILEAFKSFEKLPLVIIGNWTNSEYGINLKKKYSGIENIHLIDPIYDQTILNQFRSNAYVYVHGHSAGGTNPSLVEAMYLELPIIAFGVSYNIETTHSKAMYFDNSKDLKNILDTLDDDKLENIAKDLKNVADTNYVWKIVANKYAELF